MQQAGLPIWIGSQLLPQRLQGEKHVAVRRAPAVRFPTRADREHVNTGLVGCETDARVIVNQRVTPVQATVEVLSSTVPGTLFPARLASPLVAGSHPLEEGIGPAAADQSHKLADFAEDLFLSVTRRAEGEYLELQSRKLGLKAPQCGAKARRYRSRRWPDVQDVMEVKDDAVGPLGRWLS